MSERQIEIPESVDVSEFFGDFDSNVKLLEKALSVTLTGRESTLKITGEEENVEKCADVIDALV